MKLGSVAEVEKAFLQYVPKPCTASRNYTLDTITDLLHYLGDPQDGLKVVHVAGTSGKTSTSYFIRALLQQAGQKTGLTVSPHIISIKERTQINGDVLPDEVYIKYASEFLELVSRSGIRPSFFEIMMSFAYWVFQKEKVDYAVVETGMGGLLDGSNVARRPDKVAVITDIGLDHTHILGSTVEEIALQKAGIVHEANHLFLIEQSPEAMNTIIDYARSKAAVIQVVTVEQPQGLPSYQQRNWSLAKAAYVYVRERDGLPVLSNKAYGRAMQQTPPGRLEKLTYGDKVVILDGAHNPQKLQALGDALSEMGITRTSVLASFVTGPEYKLADNMKALSRFARHLVIPEFMVVQDLAKQSPPADEMTELAHHFNVESIAAEPDISKAIDMLLKQPDTTVVVTGSLYLVSQVRALLEKQR